MALTKPSHRVLWIIYECFIVKKEEVLSTSQYMMSLFTISCNVAFELRGFTVRMFFECIKFSVAHLRQPVALRSTWDVWRWSLRSSWWLGDESQLEWGMMTLLVRTARASWMIGIFSASQDDRFQRTPAENNRQHKQLLLLNHSVTTVLLVL